MAQKAKRPRSATRRTLPLDVASLVQMLRSVHALLVKRAKHLRDESHDTHARRGFQTLFEQRAACWAALSVQDPVTATNLARELGLCMPKEVA